MSLKLIVSLPVCLLYAVHGVTENEIKINASVKIILPDVKCFSYICHESKKTRHYTLAHNFPKC